VRKRGNFLMAMKKVVIPFWPSKFSNFLNGHWFKFSFLSDQYHPLCELTVLTQ
jgi:hypothetical protein